MIHFFQIPGGNVVGHEMLDQINYIQNLLDRIQFIQLSYNSLRGEAIDFMKKMDKMESSSKLWQLIYILIFRFFQPTNELIALHDQENTNINSYIEARNLIHRISTSNFGSVNYQQGFENNNQGHGVTSGFLAGGEFLQRCWI